MQTNYQLNQVKTKTRTIFFQKQLQKTCSVLVKNIWRSCFVRKVENATALKIISWVANFRGFDLEIQEFFSEFFKLFLSSCF